MVTGNTNNSGRVKFISYDGKYPNLCRGVLILEIAGVQYKFGHHYYNCHFNKKKKDWEFTDEDPNLPNFPPFWSSGGECYFENDYRDSIVENGEWRIDVDDLDERFKPLAYEIDKVFNDNVEYGCCGGCL